MSYANPTTPNLPDFMTFVYDVMQIDPAYLPDDSPYFGLPFSQAQVLVINAGCSGGVDYTNTVYYCGGHLLLLFTPDQAGRTFFREQRQQYGLLDQAAGVVAAVSDGGSSPSFAVTDGLKNLSIGDLNFFKTPWGRMYLAYNQDYGGIWGLS